ncbi:hypothetical protein VPH35_014550 [Triticum aestivum]
MPWRTKLHMEEPLPAGEGSSRQQRGRDVVDHVQAPVQVSPTPEQVTPLPRHLPPLPQPVVNVDGDDDDEEISPILGNILGSCYASSDGAGSSSGFSAGAGGGSSASAGCSSAAVVASPAPTCGRRRRERRRVLSDDIDSDPETQGIYRRQKVRELDSGVLEKRVRPRIGRGATDALTATS